jgi:hypothetical protein
MTGDAWPCRQLDVIDNDDDYNKTAGADAWLVIEYTRRA